MSRLLLLLFLHVGKQSFLDRQPQAKRSSGRAVDVVDTLPAQLLLLKDDAGVDFGVKLDEPELVGSLARSRAHVREARACRREELDEDRPRLCFRHAIPPPVRGSEDLVVMLVPDDNTDAAGGRVLLSMSRSTDDLYR